MPTYVHPPQSEEAIRKLLQEELPVFRNRLLEAQVPTDLRLMVEHKVVTRTLLGRSKRIGRVHLIVDAWDIPNLESVFLDDMALGRDGRIHLYYGDWGMVQGGMPIKDPTNPMTSFHLERWITVQEVRERLEHYAAAHL